MQITRSHLRKIIREELIREAISPTTAAREFELMKAYLSKFCEWSVQATSDMASAEKALKTVAGGMQSIDSFQQKHGLAHPRESEGYSIEDIGQLIPTSVKNLNILCRMIKDIENSLFSTIIDDLSFAGLSDIDPKSKRIIDNWIHVAASPALESLNMSDLQKKYEYLESIKPSEPSEDPKRDIILYFKGNALLLEGISAILEAVSTLIVNTAAYGEALRRVNPNIKLSNIRPLHNLLRLTKGDKRAIKILKYTLKLAELSRSLMSKFN